MEAAIAKETAGCPAMVSSIGKKSEARMNFLCNLHDNLKSNRNMCQWLLLIMELIIFFFRDHYILGTKIKKWEQIQGEGLFLEITAFLGTKIKKTGTDLK